MPTSGEVSVQGFRPAHRNPNFLEMVYYLPEEFHLPNLNAEAYIEATSPFYPMFDREKMKQLMSDFDLVPACKLTKISHGQKKKFRIAFALATNCPLIIFDEPTNGLDVPSKAIFRRVMASTLADNQLAIISTHQVKDIEALIDKIVMIDNGSILFSGSILDITDRYEFRTVPAPDNTAIYSEACPAGHKVILPAAGGNTEVDIELLFNALLSGANLN